MVNRRKETIQVENGLMREVEVGLLLDLNTARSLRDWLDDKVEKLEKVVHLQEAPK